MPRSSFFGVRQSSPIAIISWWTIFPFYPSLDFHSFVSRWFLDSLHCYVFYFQDLNKFIFLFICVLFLFVAFLTYSNEVSSLIAL